MISDADQLLREIQRFIETCDEKYCFPVAVRVPIPAEAEHELYGQLSDSVLSDAETVQHIVDRCDDYMCWHLLVFGARLSILAVRRADATYFRRGLFGLVVGGYRIDSRDHLRAESIYKACADRLELQILDEIAGAFNITDLDNLRSPFTGYFAGNWPTLKRCGFFVSREGADFTIKEDWDCWSSSG